MKISKIFFNLKAIFLIALITIANISFCESDSYTREQIYAKALINEVNRIISLSVYATARARFIKFLNELETYKIQKMKELEEDNSYRQDLDHILAEIRNSVSLCIENYGLTEEESVNLEKQLTATFMP